MSLISTKRVSYVPSLLASIVIRLRTCIRLILTVLMSRSHQTDPARFDPHALLANFTFDQTGEDSTLISITSPPTPLSPTPEPFLQALFNASPIPVSTSPVVGQLNSPPAGMTLGGSARLEGELKAFWVLGVGPREGEPLPKEEEVLVGLGTWVEDGKMVIG